MPWMERRASASKVSAVGRPTAENFSIVAEPMPEPGDGQVLIRTQYLSLDPYMRGRMSDAPSYAPPVTVGGLMVGGTVGEVVASNDPGFTPGDAGSLRRAAMLALTTQVRPDPAPFDPDRYFAWLLGPAR